MKKIILIIALLLSNLVHAEDLVPRDKFNHAFVGLGIYAGCFLTKGIIEATGKDVPWLNAKTCLVPVIIAGVGKEIYDSQNDNHTAEVMDAIATIAIPAALSVTIYEW